MLNKIIKFGLLCLLSVALFVRCGSKSDDKVTYVDGSGLSSESCYDCHGKDYVESTSDKHYPDDIIALTIPPGYAGIKTRLYSPRTDRGIVKNGDLKRQPGYSNKELEFDPQTDDVDDDLLQTVDEARFGGVVPSHTQQTANPGYHPISSAGRNGSWQLCNQLAKSYQLDCGCGVGAACPIDNIFAATAANALSQLRVSCWDCHEPKEFSVQDPSHGDPTHRLDQTRLLAGPYDTGALFPGRCFAQFNPPGECSKGDGIDPDPPYGSDDAFYEKFLLCFNCHDRRAFDPDLADVNDRRWTRFFGVSATLAEPTQFDGNLHMAHLRWGGSLCSECHYNLHSNVQAINTVYGDGTGGQLPPDEADGIADGVVGTHLIDFGPTVEGTTYPKPRWFFDGQAFHCYLRCHNEVMDSCAYLHPETGTPNAHYCAGGQNPGRAGKPEYE